MVLKGVAGQNQTHASATIVQQRLEHHQSNAIDPAFHIKLFPGIFLKSADGAWENI